MILLLIKLTFVTFYGDSFLYQSPREKNFTGQMRYREYELSKADYNTVFIGSSRTALGISPTYFDSLTDHKTKSYNAGIIAGTPAYTLDMCRRLIETKPSLKYVFFELSGEFKNPLNYDSWLVAFFKPDIPNRQSEDADLDLRYPLQNISLEDFLNKEDTLPSRKISPQQIEQKRSLNLKAEQADSFVSVNAGLWEQISEIIRLADSKQIRVFFFIPPRLSSEDELRLISSIYWRLESRNRLEVAHANEALYQLETSRDPIHLNHKGAKKFTELIAESFNGSAF